MADLARDGAGRTGRPCLGIAERPGSLRETYRRLALVSHRRHLDRLNPADEETLIVSSDWLLWQECAAEGRHCVSYEEGLRLWAQKSDETFDHIYDSDWCLIDGADVTRFRGVSLGRQFASEVGNLKACFLRLDFALRALIEKYAPRELVLFDYRYESNLPSGAGRANLVRTAASDYGIGFDGRLDDPGWSHPDLPRHPGSVDGPSRHIATLRDAAIFLYEFSVDALSNLIRLARRGRQPILVATGKHLNLNLLRVFDSTTLLPIYFARPMPKRPHFVSRLLLGGSLLIRMGRVPLSAVDRKSLREIIDRLRAAWSSPSRGMEQAVHDFVRRHVLENGKLEAMAEAVRRSERVFDKHRPRRVIVDSPKGTPARMRIEQAHNRGIPVDYIWHAPWSVQNFRFESLGCDPRFPVQVTRCLSWGAANDAWLDRIGAKTPRVRVGSPLIDVPSNAHRPKVQKKPERVLLLQYTPIDTDIRGLHAREYEFFVGAVRMLRDLGCDVRLKLHPGDTRISYYRRIAHFFGCELPIVKEDAFMDCVAWSDAVIGPVASGALLEVLAVGKPYFPVLLEPHGLDLTDYEGLRVFKDVESLRQALAMGQEPDMGEILNRFCGTGDIADPARRIWRAFEPATS